MCGRSTSRPICLGTRNRRPLLWKRSDNVAAPFTSMLALKYMWAKQPTTLSKWANTLAKRLAKRHEKNNLLPGFLLLDQSSNPRQSAVDNLAFYSSRLEKYMKPVSVYRPPEAVVEKNEPSDWPLSFAVHHWNDLHSIIETINKNIEKQRELLWCRNTFQPVRSVD